MHDLPRLVVQRLTGDEPFTVAGRPAGFDLLSFWQWSSSDLVVNVIRGLLAEYLVAQALGVAEGVREPWQPFDLKTPRGLTLEVKSCSYLQSWFQKKHSDVGFSIAETTAWSADTSAFVGGRQRQAHAYVFALLKHRDKATLNPRDLDQWEFFIVSTEAITERHGSRKYLSMKGLLELNPLRATYTSLPEVVSRLEDDILARP